MKKFNKIISMLLAVIMTLSALTALFTVDIFAADGVSAIADSADESKDNEEIKSVNYFTDYFATAEEKLATMKVAYKKDDIRLYVDSVSGEVAYENVKTGEKLFTNPYNIATSTGNDATKKEILSQLIVTFTDGGGQERIFTSYEQAAERGQIVVENIKNGIRVEYTIGREQSKILVPRLISMDRFEEMILQPLLAVFGDELYNPRSENSAVFDVQKALSYFMVYSVDPLELSKKDRTNIENTFGGLYDNLKNSPAQYARALKKFPIIDSMPVYVFDPDASEKELTRAEEIIQKYCPAYTYEELEYDHILTEYKSDDANPPVFRMALEYKVEDDGLSVRLPANGIRFNESLYTLEHIQILPYMGAGNSAYEGYNFFPDGSGTLFDFQNLNTNQTRAVSGKVYGTDFAYHEISGTYQKTIRYPVFGIVEEAVSYTYVQHNTSTGEAMDKRKEIDGNIVAAIEAYQNGETITFCNGQQEKLYNYIYNPTGVDEDGNAVGDSFTGIINSTTMIPTKNVNKHGFVCIIEEGDALASLTTYHAGALSDYNTIKMQFTPRPKDSYNISDSISVGANSEWTVVSDRKYVGDYSMKYILLSDTEKEDSSAKYDASWFGMAVAYRDYLTRKDILSPLTSKDLTEDIPLYIETFGTIETTEKILSIPVNVMAPLTTFDNVNKMYEELSADGMKNINFKLTGYANGGMQYTMPGRLKFEKAVGGNDGFQQLLDKANKVNKNEDSNFGVFPDFDFAYTMNSGLFDGHSAYTHNARTIDNRYASKRVYSATQQKYENYYEMVISPAYFAEFYEKLTVNYAEKYDGVLGISVSTLGTALNSDFDEDEPYNREDSKEFTVDAFDYFQKTYGQVMTDGGNAYTWKYADHILGVSLDSSRYNFASEAVPFIGVVLHGSIRFAGEPLNMEGDLKYAMLKAIENGASPYFVLSFQNTQVLKEDERLSKYYSIRYDIWGDDIASTYATINDVLKDVQDKYIIGHSFLTGGERIPDSDELTNDIMIEYNALLESHKNAAELLEKDLERAASIARENGRLAEEYAANMALEMFKSYNTQLNSIGMIASYETIGPGYYENVLKAYDEMMKAADKDLYDGIYQLVRYNNVDFDTASKHLKAQYEKYKAIIALYPTYNEELFAECANVVNNAYKQYASGNINEDEIKDNIVSSLAAGVTYDDCIMMATGYNAYRAAQDALNAIKVMGIGNDKAFETYYNVYYAMYDNEKYADYIAFLGASGSSQKDKDLFMQYYNATIACDKIDSEISTVKGKLGSLEDYIINLAKYDWMVEHREQNSISEQEIADQKSLSDSRRNKVISNLVSAGLYTSENIKKVFGEEKFDEIITATESSLNNVIGSDIMKTMKETYEKSMEYMALALDAIDIIAQSENGYQIKYYPGKPETLINIDLTDPDMPSLVEEAVTRAQAAFVYIEEGVFTKIVDGYPTEYKTSDGQVIYQSISNLSLYYYGNYEEGYQYLEKVEKDGVVSFKTYSNYSTVTYLDNGVAILQSADNDFGNDVYFAIENDKMVYYTKVSGTYIKKAPITYSGTEFSTLRDGTKIYKDGEIYYSVQDGKYTRYTYTESIKNCFETIIELNDAVFGAAVAVQNNKASSENSFVFDAVERISNREIMSIRNSNVEEEVVVEESKYASDNIVVVVYGKDQKTAYKTIILNYNNYDVKVEYEGILYTVPAYYFVIHSEEGGSK